VTTSFWNMSERKKLIELYLDNVKNNLIAHNYISRNENVLTRCLNQVFFLIAYSWQCRYQVNVLCIVLVII